MGSKVIPMNPCKGWSVSSPVGLPRVARFRVSRKGVDDRKVCGFAGMLFPSCDAGLGASLSQLLLRMFVAAVAMTTAFACIAAGRLEAAIMLISGGVLLGCGLLVRPAALCVAAGLCIVMTDMTQLQMLLSAVALAAILVLVRFGGGWFSADYFIGRGILNRRMKMRRLDYKALSRAAEVMQ